MSKIGVIGSGAWGLTLATLLSRNGHDVLVWCHNDKVKKEINERHTLKSFFSDTHLPESIRGTVDLTKAVNGADFVLLVVASHFYRSMAQKLRSVLQPSQIIISATKGLEENTHKRMSEIAAEEMGPEVLSRYVVLSGPNLSKEIMKGLPATAVAASSHIEAAQKVQKLLSYERFRVYTHTDVIGVELGGTLKNIIALAAGIVDGLKLGDNAKSALMVRAAVEMVRLAVALGAEQDTLLGLSGMGDMITTCSSPFSRNHQVGVKLAKGWSLEKILKSMKAVAEGVKTAKATYELAQAKHVDMPITEQVYKVLYEGRSPKDSIFDLMMRDPKSEKQV